MTIKDNLCPSIKYPLKCPYTMFPTGICIHNTANDASAKSEINYMLNNSSSTSYHYAVDDTEIVHAIPDNRNAWHAGDGSNGTGNRKYIAIEICYSKSGGAKFEAAMKNAARLTAKLLKDHGWDISHVKKHQDFNGKYCPHRILSDYGWDYFIDLVRAELGETKIPTPVLTKGAMGEAVKKLQSRLNKWGYLIEIDGSFGPITLEAVKDFQGKQNLVVDGSVGPLTWAALLKEPLEEVSEMAKFADTKGHWAEEIIDELAEMGIVHGDENGDFRPDDKITRAEAVAIARNAIKYIVGK